MAVVILKSVGESGENKPNDVQQIDALLSKVGMYGSTGVSLLHPALAYHLRNEAIKRFQRIWNLKTKGVFDGTISPGGMTLRRLNETAEPLQLNPITVGLIAKGGYLVSFSPKAPPEPYQLRFGVSPAATDHVDVSGCKSSDVLSPEHLPELLKLVKKYQRWGQALSVRLFVVFLGKVITVSAPQLLPCPVQPHNGYLLPLDERNNGPKLTYQGDPNKEEDAFWGRLLQRIEGFDGYFFKYGGRFETNNAFRGFDCITYAGITCGAPHDSMGKDGLTLANTLKAEKCSIDRTVKNEPPKGEKLPANAPPTKVVKVELENTDPQNVKDFFAANGSGYYLMWSGAHIVIVADGVVHEFAGSRNGYWKSAVQTWLEPYKVSRITVRKLSAKPALATPPARHLLRRFQSDRPRVFALG